MKNILLREAVKYLGTPYKHGATPEEAPQCFDCSSFIQFIFKKAGVELPRRSDWQAQCGIKISGIKNLLPGDLLFFEGNKKRSRLVMVGGQQIWIGHVAMYLGNSEIIHCTNKNWLGVSIRSLEKARKKIVLIKRVLPNI